MAAEPKTKPTKASVDAFLKKSAASATPMRTTVATETFTNACRMGAGVSALSVNRIT